MAYAMNRRQLLKLGAVAAVVPKDALAAVAPAPMRWHIVIHQAPLDPAVIARIRLYVNGAIHTGEWRAVRVTGERWGNP